MFFRHANRQTDKQKRQSYIRNGQYSGRQKSDRQTWLKKRMDRKKNILIKDNYSQYTGWQNKDSDCNKHLIIINKKNLWF